MINKGQAGEPKMVMEDLDASDDEQDSKKDSSKPQSVVYVNDLGSSESTDVEISYNAQIQERNYYTVGSIEKLEASSSMNRAHSNSASLGPAMDSLPAHPGLPTRQSSVYFFSNLEYEAIETLPELIRSKDKSGNTALHHCAFIGLLRCVEILIECGASKWVLNNNKIPAAAILDKVATLDPIVKNLVEDDESAERSTIREIPLLMFDDTTLQLYKSIRRRMLLPRHLIQGYDFQIAFVKL